MLHQVFDLEFSDVFRKKRLFAHLVGHQDRSQSREQTPPPPNLDAGMLWHTPDLHEPQLGLSALVRGSPYLVYRVSG